jgi:hypothetical protein
MINKEHWPQKATRPKMTFSSNFNIVMPNKAKNLKPLVSEVCTHGTQCTKKHRVRLDQATSRRPIRPRRAFRKWLGLLYRHNIPAQPWVVGTVSRIHLRGSKAGGKLIHKLIKVARITQVSWQIKVMSATYPPAYYYAIIRGCVMLHHYEMIIWSKICMTCDNQPNTWPSKQWIRHVPCVV